MTVIFSNNQPHLLGDYVHHVWVTDDPTMPLNALKGMVKKHEDVFEELIREDQDRYHMKFRILDKHLQELVTYLDKMGCDLLSPDAPQPGENKEVKFSGKLVEYDVDFVKR